MLLRHAEGMLTYCRIRIPLAMMEFVNSNIEAQLRLDVAVDELHHCQWDSDAAVGQHALCVPKQHVGQFLHGLGPLSPQLIDPALEEAQHRASIATAPQATEVFLQQVSLGDEPVECEWFVELLLLCVRSNPP